MRNIFTSNIRFKLLAVIFATALWFFVAGQSNTEVGFIVPIGFKGIPKDLVMSSTPPEEVEVRVIGPKLFVNNLSASQILAELDLSGAREGVNAFRLSPGDIVKPMGVDIIKVRPSSFDIRMERLISADLKVRPRLSGRPQSGFKVADAIVFPRTITASGVKKEIKDLDAIYTKPIDVSGLNYSTSITIPLDTSDFEFRSLSRNTVEVKLVIRKER